jgi:hypothetical protein
MNKQLTTMAACLLIALPCTLWAQSEPIPDIIPAAPRVMMSDATFLIFTLGAMGGLLVSPGERPHADKSWFEAEELDKPLELGNANGSGWGVGGLGRRAFLRRGSPGSGQRPDGVVRHHDRSIQPPEVHREPYPTRRRRLLVSLGPYVRRFQFRVRDVASSGLGDGRDVRGPLDRHRHGARTSI